MSTDTLFVPEPPWVAPVYVYVGDLLEQHSPSFPPPVERQEALMALGAKPKSILCVTAVCTVAELNTVPCGCL